MALKLQVICTVYKVECMCVWLLTVNSAPLRSTPHMIT